MNGRMMVSLLRIRVLVCFTLHCWAPLAWLHRDKHTKNFSWCSDGFLLLPRTLDFSGYRTTWRFAKAHLSAVARPMEEHVMFGASINSTQQTVREACITSSSPAFAFPYLHFFERGTAESSPGILVFSVPSCWLKHRHGCFSGLCYHYWFLTLLNVFTKFSSGLSKRFLWNEMLIS